MPPALPVALTSLSIRDFRGIDRLDLDFRGPDGLPNNLIVLAGPNGSGKTAVLEAALIAAGGFKLATGPRGKRGIRKGASDYSIEAVFDVGGTRFETIDRPGTPSPEPSSKRPFWYFSSWRAPEFVGPIGVTIGRPGRRPAKNDQNRLLNVKQILINAAAIGRFRPDRGLFEADSAKWMAQINRY